MFTNEFFWKLQKELRDSEFEDIKMEGYNADEKIVVYLHAVAASCTEMLAFRNTDKQALYQMVGLLGKAAEAFEGSLQ